MRSCRLDLYLGHSDVIEQEPGKNLVGRVFQANADMLHITSKSIPFEAAQLMLIGERYHKPLRRAYAIIMKECSGTEKSIAQQIVVNSLYKLAEPDGLVLTVLVYRDLPCLGLPTGQPMSLTFKRAGALRKAIDVMSLRLTSSL